jgi:hypothetical protein
MKKRLLALLSITLLLIASCAKKKCCDFPTIADFIITQKNGAEWKFDPLSLATAQDTAIISGTNNVADMMEIFGFKLKLNGLGYYELKSDEGFYNITKGSETVARYKLSTTHNNTVIVVALNEKDKIIQGLFNVRFVKIFDKPVGSQPDSIRFLEGKFKVSLHN